MHSWSRDELLTATPAIDWQFQSPTKHPQWHAYLTFYGLNQLQEDHPLIDHYPGLWSTTNHQLVVQSWRWRDADLRQTAIVMHGYYDHVGLFGSLINFCLEQGWNVVCVDLPGHGLSSGMPASIADFSIYDEVLANLVESVGLSPNNRGHLFAQSMGGAIAINYCLKRQFTVANSPFQHIGLLAPLIRPAKWWKVKFLHTLLSPFLKQVKRAPTESSNAPEFIEFVNQHDPLQASHLSVQWLTAMRRWLKKVTQYSASELPVIVLQGDQEYTVDHTFNLAWIAAKFPRQLRIMLPGMRHHLVNETELLQAQMYRDLRWSLNHSNRQMAQGKYDKTL